MGITERHHILYSRTHWEATPDGKLLRRQHMLIPRLEPSIHKLVHDEVSIVPILDRHTMRTTARNFYPVRNDTLASLDNLMLAIEEASQNPKLGQVEKALAQLCIWGLEAQKPLIAEGLIVK